MTYKKKLYILIAVTAVLALLYTGSLIFNSDFAARRSFFVWLDSETAKKTTRIVIKSYTGEYEISMQNNLWFILHDEKVFPARQIRVQDFLNALTTRSSWEVRSSSASSHERFGVDDMSASRITLYADNSVILDLILGGNDVIRNETYFRRYGQNEVRSGDSSISTYINSSLTGWYNLRLLSGADGEPVDISTVQRVSVYTPEEVQTFTRRNRSWVITEIEIANPDISALESYIRTILSTEGDSFSDISWEDPILDHSRIVLELGYGRALTIRLSEGDESGRVFAHVSGSDYVYSIPSWSAQRLFMPAESFETL